MNHMFSAQQLGALLPDVVETAPESVTVKGSRVPVACCGTYIALPWAIAHPRQLWRIFTPVTGPCRGMWCTEPGD